MKPTFLAAAVLLPLALLRGQSPTPVPAPSLASTPENDAARFLAGLPPLADTALLETASVETWQRHSSLLSKTWKEFEDSQLAKVRAWSRMHNSTASASSGTLFYPFSGPDFLYANAIFPEATTYVLCGKEPVGFIPHPSELRANQLAGELQALRHSLSSVLSFSFFITKQMKQELQDHKLGGTLPVLAIFLARTGKTISSISYVGLDSDGRITPLSEPSRNPDVTAVGVKFTFRSSSSDPARTLYYFSTDISNDGLKRSSFLEFCKSLAPGNAFVKSDSYLLHESEFSTMRSFLLENASTLVQDDSGIPVSFLNSNHWNLQVFGSYPGPISSFKNKYQSALAGLYRKSNPVPLDFGIGYRHHTGESTLMIATRRMSVPANPGGQPESAPSQNQ